MEMEQFAGGGMVVMLAGIIRGMTGFGGAMLMAPPLSLLLGPVPAVVTALMLETTAALVMFPDAWPRFNRRALFYLTAPACVTVPIGGYLLVNVDAFLMRKVIAGVVVVFALALLSGVRYSGAPRPATSLALGSIVGVLLGATRWARLRSSSIYWLVPTAKPSSGRISPCSSPPYRLSA
jgi:uncharacterized membrane protein YfcA